MVVNKRWVVELGSPACWARSVSATLPWDSAMYSNSLRPRVSDWIWPAGAVPAGAVTLVFFRRLTGLAIAIIFTSSHYSGMHFRFSSHGNMPEYGPNGYLLSRKADPARPCCPKGGKFPIGNRVTGAMPVHWGASSSNIMDAMPAASDFRRLFQFSAKNTGSVIWRFVAPARTGSAPCRHGVRRPR